MAGNKKRKRELSSSEDDEIPGKLMNILKRLDDRLRNLEKQRHKKPRRKRHHDTSVSESKTEDSESSISELLDEEELPSRQSVVDATEQPPLEPAVRCLLGEVASNIVETSEEMQADIACVWKDILASGLKKETLEDLTKKYPPAKNCLVTQAPQLNKEVELAVGEAAKSRDARLATIQSQMGVALSALGKGLSKLINQESDNEIMRPYIEIISDAARILADIHHSQSLSRRSLVCLDLEKGLDKNLKETVEKSPIDKMLFGVDLNERLKDAELIKKSSLGLKVPKTVNKSRAYAAKKHLNSKGLPRQVNRVTHQGRQKFQYQSSYHQHQGRQNTKTMREAARRPISTHESRKYRH